MQRYTMVFTSITINALHVSGGSSAHHQELKTVYSYTVSGIYRVLLLLTAIVSEPELTSNSTITHCCV